MNEKRQQVADQCRVVAHLAKAIWEVHSDHARIFASDSKGPDEIVDIVGNRTAQLMETLGEILNGMDAVGDDDYWVDAIFEKAHFMFPQKSGVVGSPKP